VLDGASLPHDLRDLVSTYLMVSIVVSLVATALGSLVDVVKIKSMGVSSETSIPRIIRGIYEAEGFRRLFRGWPPSFVCLGLQTIITLLFLEQHRRVYRSLTGMGREIQ
jgi:dicarboxylate transporter 10